MSNIAPFPVRNERNTPTISELNLNRTMPGTSYVITTMAGSKYEVRRNAHPKEQTPANAAMAHVFMSKDGGDEHPQYASALITVGKAWDIAIGHPTSPVTSIELV